MPRASYGDKEVVSIIFSTSENNNAEKNRVLDFTSKVIDFLVISSGMIFTMGNQYTVLKHLTLR